jgi:hypothetical protein
MGNGYPVAAFGGRAAVMDKVGSHAGGVVHGGTYTANLVGLGASNLELTATVRSVAAWGVSLGAAAPPPASPVDCSAPGSCGEPYTATFVPYGATHLRMTQLPWTAVPPCGSSVAYNGSATALLRGSASDWDAYAGAGIEPNGADENVRSGDPGDVSTAAWMTSVRDATHSVVGAAFSFQYVAGYGGDGAPGGATLSLVALAAGPCGPPGGALLATLYTSPALSHSPFDSCNTCYSPPVNVSLPPGSFAAINASAGVVFALRFHDNQRNVQLKLPINLAVEWSA